ncbi:hypothetical protein R6Q59_005547 [Mikania micrantha]
MYSRKHTASGFLPSGLHLQGEFSFHLSFTLATSATLISLRYDRLPPVPFCLFFGLSSQGVMVISI